MRLSSKTEKMIQDMIKATLKGKKIAGGSWIEKPEEDVYRFSTYHVFSSIADALDWAASMPQHDGAVPKFIDDHGRMYDLGFISCEAAPVVPQKLLTVNEVIYMMVLSSYYEDRELLKSHISDCVEKLFELSEEDAAEYIKIHIS